MGGGGRGDMGGQSINGETHEGHRPYGGDQTSTDYIISEKYCYC